MGCQNSVIPETIGLKFDVHDYVGDFTSCAKFHKIRQRGASRQYGIMYALHFGSRFTDHHTGRRVPPFTRHRLGLPHELAHCVIPGWSQFMLRCSHCWGICERMFERVGPACGQARSSNPRGKACRPNGKGTREERVLSDVVPELFILPGLKIIVSRRLIQTGRNFFDVPPHFSIVPPHEGAQRWFVTD